MTEQNNTKVKLSQDVYLNPADREKMILFAQFSHTISSMITDFWDIAPCGIVEVG
jgi:hypothetical protein